MSDYARRANPTYAACDTFTDNAVPVYPGRAQEIRSPLLLNDHSIDVPARGQSREFVVKICGSIWFAPAIHKPGSPISKRIWAIARLQCSP